jgi:hypothetical protein
LEQFVSNGAAFPRFFPFRDIKYCFNNRNKTLPFKVDKSLLRESHSALYQLPRNLTQRLLFLRQSFGSASFGSNGKMHSFGSAVIFKIKHLIWHKMNKKVRICALLMREKYLIPGSLTLTGVRLDSVKLELSKTDYQTWHYYVEKNYFNGIESSVPNPWHFGVDPDPDPRILASDYRIRIRIRIRMRIRILLFSSLTFKKPTKN